MGRPFNKTHFDNPARLSEMLSLRFGSPQWSYTQLGVKYGVDHSTIVYHVKKARRLGLTPKLLARHPALYPQQTAAQMRAIRRLWRVQVVGPTTVAVLLLPWGRSTVQPAAPKPWEKYQKLFDEEFVQINPGKNYREYRRDSKKRYAAQAKETTARLTAEFEQRVAQRGRINTGSNWLDHHKKK